MPKRMTRQTLRLLEAFLSDVSREWYGFDLMEKTGLKSGTIYPILHRLAIDGWLVVFEEEIDPKHEGRPARRLYRLTGLGEAEARANLKRRSESVRGTTKTPLPLTPKGASI